MEFVLGLGAGPVRDRRPVLRDGRDAGYLGGIRHQEVQDAHRLAGEVRFLPAGVVVGQFVPARSVGANLAFDHLADAVGRDLAQVPAGVPVGQVGEGPVTRQRLQDPFRVGGWHR